jgi:hypothetical protein
LLKSFVPDQSMGRLSEQALRCNPRTEEAINTAASADHEGSVELTQGLLGYSVIFLQAAPISKKRLSACLHIRQVWKRQGKVGM